LACWWPNLFDAREELSGTDGTVLGLLTNDPPAEAEAFDALNGWVQLRPILTNEVFTP